jgi:predicted nucleic acid-binding protein
LVKGNKNISTNVLKTGFNNIVSSDISKAELYYGAYKSKKVTSNLASIKHLSERINFLPFNEPAQEIFGKSKALLEKKGTRLDDLDLMIASTALSYNLTLVTNNADHMSRIPDLTIENWV